MYSDNNLYDQETKGEVKCGLSFLYRKKDRLWGYVNADGTRLVIDFAFHDACDFDERTKLARVYVIDKTNSSISRWTNINTKGEFVE